MFRNPATAVTPMTIASETYSSEFDPDVPTACRQRTTVSASKHVLVRVSSNVARRSTTNSCTHNTR